MPTEPPGIENPFDGPDPYIEEPDEHQTGDQEIFCWMPMNSDRRCGGDCVAYEPVCEGDVRIDSCKVLNALRGGAKGLQVLGLSFKQAEKKRDNEKLTEQLGSIPDPPKVQ